jgi:hypothetical protein
MIEAAWFNQDGSLAIREKDNDNVICTGPFPHPKLELNEDLLHYKISGEPDQIFKISNNNNKEYYDLFNEVQQLRQEIKELKQGILI